MITYLPKSLKKNSTIGLICPASGFDDYKPIKLAIKYLKSKGYKIKLGRSLVVSIRIINTYHLQIKTG